MNRVLRGIATVGVAVLGSVTTAWSADPVVGTGIGLLGYYFPNPTCSGSPLVQRTDAQLNFSWGGGSPDPVIPTDNFSVRWQGEIQPRYSETYTLTTRSDDGVRLWLDGVLVINDWNDHGLKNDNYTFTAEAGRHYTIQIEYYDHAGSASAQLWWQSPSETFAPVPSSQLYPEAWPERKIGNGSGLLAGYFPGPSFTGRPIKRLDSGVNFTWPTIPAEGIPADHFSVRWQGKIIPVFDEPTTVIFTSDDGLRVWLDGNMVVDDWTAHANREYRITIPAGISPHDLRIDYYEETGPAVARMEWQGTHLFREVVPAAQLMPASALITPVPTSGQGLSASYFANEAMTGTPVLAHVQTIAANWGKGSPHPAIPTEHFAVRWTGFIQTRFDEDYTLIAKVDDVVRIWLDDVKILDVDDWSHEHRYTFSAQAGRKYRFRMEMADHSNLASAMLEWDSVSEARQIVPEACFYPNDVDTVLPASSVVSPAFIEGIHAPATTVTASTGAGVVALGETRWMVNQPLDPASPTSVTCSAGSAQVAGAIAWTPTVLSGTASITIRPGDSLLIASRAPGTWRIDSGYDAIRQPAPISVDDRIPVAFPNPGRFSVIENDADDVEIASLTVIVPGFTDTITAIPDAVSYQRTVDILVQDASDLSQVTWMSCDDWMVATPIASPASASPANQRLTILPSWNRVSALVARINGPRGPVIRSWPVRPFVLRSDSEKSNGMTIIQGFADGSWLCGGNLIQEPFVPGLDVKLFVIVSGVTFDDGTTTRWLTSSRDFIMGADGTGTCPYRIIRSPGIATGNCHWWIAYDQGVQVSSSQ